MKVGDYVRTKCYGIQKITGFISDLENDYIDCDYDETTRCLINKKEIIKSSPNIIDLIEAGDYVDRLRVVDKEEDYIVVETFDERIVITKKDTINSVVTKEQFESMKYKVKE